MPQELALYPLLTCRENLEAFGRYQGLRGKALRDGIAWCLEWAALADRAGAVVKTLSGGMRRRLNMAAGLVHRPRIVLLDEPTVGVDPQSRNRIFDMVSELRGQGATVIYTTHYMEEAERLCDAIAIIDHGRVIAQGAKEELVERSFGRRSDVLMRFAASVENAAAWAAARGGTLDDGRRAFRRGAAHRHRRAAGCGMPRRPGGDRRGAAPPQSRICVSATHRKGSTPMIAAIVRNGFRALRRDRGALILSFVLPIAFFSIFGVIFGGMGGGSTPRVSVLVVDEDRSAVSERLVHALLQEPSLDASTHPKAKKGEPVPADYTAATAEAAVKQGDAPAALIIPKGFGAHPIAFGPGSDRAAHPAAARQLRSRWLPRWSAGMLQKW